MLLAEEQSESNESGLTRNILDGIITIADEEVRRQWQGYSRLMDGLARVVLRFASAGTSEADIERLLSVQPHIQERPERIANRALSMRV
jgi:hypothetical protein